MHLLSSDSPVAAVAAWGGGKAANLHALEALAVPVPCWAALGSDVFDHVITHSGLEEATLRNLSASSELTEIERASRTITEHMRQMELDLGVLDLIEKAYGIVGGGEVAIRSSAREEDGTLHSFAGQFSSFLYVSGRRALIDRVRDCWASAYSVRAIQYRLSHGLGPIGKSMAVIVQRMVPADASGVLFTVNPTTGDCDETVVSCTYGLGEALVSGAVDADTVVLHRFDRTVRSVVIGEKAERYDRDPQGTGCRAAAVPDADRSRLAVSEQVLWRLADLGAHLERELGGAQDIEWAITSDQIQVLQTRPITALPPGPHPSTQLRVWDNSNIIESYDGITSPLTFTFASHVYHQVHYAYCRMLGLRGQRLREMQEWLPNMLGHIHGRVYYNLLNWYRMMRLLPMYSIRRGALETSMGLSEVLDEATATDLRPYTPRGPVREAAVRAQILLRYGRRALTNQRDVRRFVNRFDRVFQEVNSVDFASASADEVYRRFQAFERKILPYWGPMVILESVILTSFAILRWLTKRWLPDAPDWFLWSIVSPGDQIESTEPARALTRLAQEIKARPELEKVVLASTDSDTIRAAFQRAGADDLIEQLDTYLERYGYRSLNELKLEEPDLHQDPSVLFQMLAVTITSEVKVRTEDSVAAARTYLVRHLRPGRRMTYKWVAKRVRRSLEARERVRFCRTRAFGVVRRMMLAIGTDLARGRRLGTGRDIFYLRLDEIRACLDGTWSHGDLRDLVALRKTESDRFTLVAAPARFTTTGSVYRESTLSAVGWRPVVQDLPERPLPVGHRFEGTPCSPGVAEGTARVVDRPQDAAGEIIVTYRTDPGWISVLPTAAALLIERGSPLTHIAIVARELGVPTVVQIKDLTTNVKDGVRLRVDGAAGTATVIDS